ncbi:uncharacterized protein LOC126898685 [Daktulosphaira vitifoliae]|uniref:uncharacterized protein LOC126898685 n=1 Tax=Daktulosphaira vitifoliae TaxID=58002 RepID=UPI0021AAB2CA|nr:uncharacterized protein LOC126898685 [Daktulosphaira vitifoliae]
MKIRKLLLLTTAKSLGESVRRIMTKMFHDSVLVQFSTYGFKKKQRFADLLSYHLIKDIIRTNVKYEMVPEKEIDCEISVWLAHASFQIINREKRSAK